MTSMPSSLENGSMVEHPSNHNERTSFLTRQMVALNDNKTRKRKFNKADNQGEATLLDTEQDEYQIFSPDENQSNNIINNNNQQSESMHLFSPDELDTTTILTRTNVIPTPKRTSTLPVNVQTRKPISKIPIRSRLRSATPTKNPRQTPSSVTNKGAFHFFMTDDHQRIASSGDDEDGETNHFQKIDLKQKLKEEKRQGKKTGELLNKLHENYEELLEKYAQAENTIDQLRFHPKISGNNTPKSNTSEHFIHLTHPSKTNITTLRSSGAYHSTTASPFSSIRPVPSTTTTTPARKSVSPTNSGTIESIFFEEAGPEKIVREKVRRVETLKLDLLIETKNLEEKMKSFLTLMDANQLNLAEQKQVYEIIKQDYENLMKVCDHNKRDLDGDLMRELETMKQLLKDIVKKITQNLLGKSSTDSSEQQTRDENHSSQLSARSSPGNHNDVMNEYGKLVATINTTKKDPVKSVMNESITNSPPLNHKPKAYIYVSADSDDEQQQQTNGITPIPYTKSIASTSFEPDYIPSTSVKQARQSNDKRKTSLQQIHTNGIRYSHPRLTDYDSGIGTNNLTKLSHDSKLYPSTMDESHFQSLDDEQESISASSRSSGTGSVSSGSPYSKRFDNRSGYRRKPSGHSDSHQSDIQTHLTGSFDLPPQSSSSSSRKQMHQSYHTWKPQKTFLSRRSRLTPIHRSLSSESPAIEDYKIKSFRSFPTPQISSKITTNQHFYHQQKTPPRYRSSLYISQTHTHQGLQNKLDQNLYLDSKTGIVYRSESDKTADRPRIYPEPAPPTKLYRCTECAAVTTYHHRHHIHSSLKPVTTNSDDPGYESGYQKRHRRYQYIDYLSSSSSSESDSDIDSSYHEMIALHEAYNRAEKIQYRSRCLSKYIIRQLKLALATL